MYEYKYPRPMVTVDMVVLTADRKNIVLIKRRNEPCKGCWALPGGFIEMDETLEESAMRELREETSLSGIKLTKFDVFGEMPMPMTMLPNLNGFHLIAFQSLLLTMRR